MTPTAVVEDGPALTQRSTKSSLRSLLVLSQLMMESASERQVLQLASGAARSLVPCRTVQVAMGPQDGLQDRAAEARLADAAALGAVGMPVEAGDGAWVCAYPLRSLRGQLGWFVFRCERCPSEDDQFLLRTLAQQTGAAVANLRLHLQERLSATRVAEANEQLQQTLEALQRSMAVHARLTRAAASGEGPDGIARAVHEVTGNPVGIEDRYGNLQSWAGPDRPDPYPKAPAARRELLLRRALRASRPIRDGHRLVAVSEPQRDVIGVLVLMDPDGTAGDQQMMAMEHGLTVLAMELARLRSLAESELRIRRDLVEELLSGTDEESALRRAQALGYDLQRPHRVVVLEGRGRERDDDAFLHAVRRAARDEPAGTLMLRRARQVIVLADTEADWEHFRGSVVRHLGGGRCRLAVGSLCHSIADIPQSLHQAELALRLQETASWGDRAISYDELGVYQLLAEVHDPGAAEAFIQRWLGPLLEYDRKRNSELVASLSRYLECGGNYDNTSSALFIHRSTLKYRLQRIRDISGWDLNEPDTRFNLQLATRAWETLRALHE